MSNGQAAPISGLKNAERWNLDAEGEIDKETDSEEEEEEKKWCRDLSVCKRSGKIFDVLLFKNHL